MWIVPASPDQEAAAALLPESDAAAGAAGLAGVEDPEPCPEDSAGFDEDTAGAPASVVVEVARESLR